MVRCWICEKPWEKSVSYFRFPKDTNIQKVWKQVCDLLEGDDVSRLAICEKHFRPEDYLEPRAKEFGGKLVLKRKAVPSLDVPFPRSTEQNETEVIVYVDPSVMSSGGLYTLLPASVQPIAISQNETEANVSNSFITYQLVNQCETDLMNPSLDFTETSNTIISAGAEQEDESKEIIAKLSETRTVKTEYTADFDFVDHDYARISESKSSGRTRKVLNNADKKLNKQQTMKIKQLRAKVRGLERKLTSLQTTVDHLNNKKVDNENTNIFSPDCINRLWNTCTCIEDVIDYVSGFIAHNVLKQIDCAVCKKYIITKDCSVNRLKFKGQSLFPSTDVVLICSIGENFIREYQYNKKYCKNMKATLTNRIFERCASKSFNYVELIEHTKSQSVIDNHIIQLIKLIIDQHLSIRLYSSQKNITQINE